MVTSQIRLFVFGLTPFGLLNGIDFAEMRVMYLNVINNLFMWIYMAV